MYLKAIAGTAAMVSVDTFAESIAACCKMILTIISEAFDMKKAGYKTEPGNCKIEGNCFDSMMGSTFAANFLAAVVTVVPIHSHLLYSKNSLHLEHDALSHSSSCALNSCADSLLNLN